MHFYDLEFGGGLGDVFFQMFHRGAYNVLRDLEPADIARVDLICHNPNAYQLFSMHPKASQINLREFPYWTPKVNDEKRNFYDLPSAGRNESLPEKDQNIQFHPDDRDLERLAAVESHPYIVLAAGSSLLHKQIPDALVDRLVDRLLTHSRYDVLVTGASYEAKDDYGNERYEYEPQSTSQRVHDRIDLLTVHGLAHAVSRSKGVICSHSAVGILGWLLNKPQLLLYPKSHYKPFIEPVPRTLWGFGLDNKDTVACEFRQFQDEYIDRLFGA